MKLNLETQEVNGIEMSFLDIQNSWTVTEVFNELRDNPYGIEDAELDENDILVDVGGNVGMFSIYAHMKFGCRIIAFEPIKINFENFNRNILLNRLNPDKFQVYNCAITDKEGDLIRFGKFDYNSGGASKFYNYKNNTEECRTETLSKYITEDCKFLKIDCEGSEYEIIPSIMDKINFFKYIGIEYHEVLDNSPQELHYMIKKNFTGKLYPEKINQVITISPFYL